MRRSPCPAFLALTLAAAASACSGAPRARAGDVSAYEAAARRNRPAVSPADVRFMTGMIPHHAQAVLFAGWAEPHGAGRAVEALCERIVVAQRDEIETMRAWLRDRGEPVPSGDPGSADTRMGAMAHDMGGMEHPALMPGMLTGEQLAGLDAARGEDFDRLFLMYMIPHHQGALLMVDELFASYGGAQDDFVYKLASDIYADQTTEIERMQRMLAAMQPENRIP